MRTHNCVSLRTAEDILTDLAQTRALRAQVEVVVIHEVHAGIAGHVTTAWSMTHAFFVGKADTLAVNADEGAVVA